MTFERFIAVRYFKAKRKGLFSLLTTLLGIAGVTLGVAVLIATMSVMNGFQTDIERRVVGAQAHLLVYGGLTPELLSRAEAVLKSHPEVVATAPFVLGQAILTCEGRSNGILLKGLEPAREFKVNDLAKTLKEGSWAGLEPAPAPPAPSHPRKGAGPAKAASSGAPLPGIVLGTELAKMMGAWVGTQVVLLSPQGADTPIGLIPKMRKFRVTGLLHTGYYEFDSSTAYIQLQEAASLLGVKSGATGLEARLTNLDLAEPLAHTLQRELGLDYSVRSFKQMNQTLFAALRLEKYMMFLLLTFIILVASFNITSNLILLGTEKLRDIGLLKAMGATPGQIRVIFLWEGLLIGSVGVLLGVALGLLICFLIARYPPFELPADIYYLTQIPVDVETGDVLVVIGAGMALSLLSSLYPAWHASKLRPVEVLQEA